MSGAAEEDEGDEEQGGPAAGRRAPRRQEVRLAGRWRAEERTGSSCSAVGSVEMHLRTPLGGRQIHL